MMFGKGTGREPGATRFHWALSCHMAEGISGARSNRTVPDDQTVRSR